MTSSANVILLLSLLLLLQLIVPTEADNVADTITNCGLNRGCWLTPSGCEDPTGPLCTGIFSWTVNADGFNFAVEMYIEDLRVAAADVAYYGAVGFSLDELMGDDTVLICSVDNTGYGSVLLGWNDHNKNYLQLQASEVILSNSQASIVNGRMQCEGRYNFDGWLKVEAPNRLYDLKDGNLSFHFLFARGTSDPRSHILNMHSVWDGGKFPYIASQSVSLCANGCGGLGSMSWIKQSHQSVIPRIYRFLAAMFHGSVMSLSTFVVISTGVLTSRFGRAYHQDVWGSALWFQVHRGCMLIAFAGMTLSVFFIYWQASFIMFVNCSTICGIEDYQKQVHSILGTLVYTLVVAQVVGGMLRPPLSSTHRQIWNWAHSVNGTCIWIGCCSCCILAIPMEKTGLATFYNKIPNNVMMMSIFAFICCFALCTWFVYKDRFVTPDPDRVEKIQNGQQEEESATTAEMDPAAAERKFKWTPALIIMIFNVINGLSTFAIIIIMLIKIYTAFSKM